MQDLRNCFLSPWVADQGNYNSSLLCKGDWRNVSHGLSIACQISSKLHCLPVGHFPIHKMERKGVISILPSLTRMSLNEIIYQIPGALEKIGAVLSPDSHTHPHTHYLLPPAGWHDTQLPRNIRVGSIQLQSCYIFLQVRIVLQKSYAQLLSLF